MPGVFGSLLFGCFFACGLLSGSFLSFIGSPMRGRRVPIGGGVSFMPVIGIMSCIPMPLSLFIGMSFLSIGFMSDFMSGCCSLFLSFSSLFLSSGLGGG